MTVVQACDWERHPDGEHISFPIAPADLDDVRAWCSAHCRGDFLIVLSQRVLFQSHEDASLAAGRWRAEEDRPAALRALQDNPRADHQEMHARREDEGQRHGFTARM